MATAKQTETNAEALAVPSLFSVLTEVVIVGAEASFELTEELRSAVEQGFKATQANPGGWLKVGPIPEQVANPDGTVTAYSDDECKRIFSERESDLRAASAQMGYQFRRNTPKNNGKETAPRVMLYRINKRTEKGGEGK